MTESLYMQYVSILCLTENACNWHALILTTHKVYRAREKLAEQSKLPRVAACFSHVHADSFREDLTSRGLEENIYCMHVFDIFHLTREKSQRLRMLRA
jgi:hypothetical protein